MPAHEFYAFQFLTQWIDYEDAHYEAFRKGPTKNDVRRALSYFGIARNFQGEKKETESEKKKERCRIAGIILDSLNAVRELGSESEAAKVNSLAEKFQESFNSWNLSAASKLLWLSERRCIIYDSRAVRALKRDFGRKDADQSYLQYVNAWRDVHKDHKDAIASAVEKLPNARWLMRECPLPDEELLAMVRETWFLERTFDVYLWHIGEPKEQPGDCD